MKGSEFASLVHCRNTRDLPVLYVMSTDGVGLNIYRFSFRLKRESYQNLKKMVFTVFLRGSQHKKRDSVDNMPASLLVVSLGKVFNGMPPSSCGR